MKRTPLYETHRASGATMTPFGGFEMPLRYRGIQTEHHAVRNHAGLFDLGHMGRIALRGPERLRLLERVATNAWADLPPGRARYGLLCDEQGGVIDDIIAYVLPDELLVVVNASNHETDLAWITAERDRAGYDCEIVDRSEELGMLALQGPRALAVLERLGGTELAAMPYYGIGHAEIAGSPMLAARTGYTGEDGFELYLPAEALVQTWHAILEAGESEGVLPCGLGARDTLRLEAAMPLYGHELGREINPYEAGLGFAVRLDKSEHSIGHEALARIRATGPRRRLACIVCEGRRIPRQGHGVLRDGTEVGRVTSGSYSPTLERPIAMALIAREAHEIDAPVTIDVRGRAVAGRIVRRPFYKREKKDHV